LAAISAGADLGFAQPVTNSTAWQKCMKRGQQTHERIGKRVDEAGFDVALVGTRASIDALVTFPAEWRRYGTGGQIVLAQEVLQLLPGRLRNIC
jgi:hypothetical protein